MAMKKVPVKKPAQHAQKKLGISKSGKAIAQALTQAYPKDAEHIVQIMRNAATSASMKRKLGRVEVALESLKKGQSNESHTLCESQYKQRAISRDATP